ncbi:MAG TPA: hypothetical protein PKE31_00945 [Pseudomonadota bacterium]|nr:hypothetical protein [Pseudomonadota bacterium]
MRRGGTRLWARLWADLFLGLCLGLCLGACGEAEKPLEDPDADLYGLEIVSLQPTTLLPASDLVVTGRALPPPGEGALYLSLSGTSQPPEGAPRNVEVRLRLDYTNSKEAHRFVDTEMLGALLGNSVDFSGHARIVVASFIDRKEHITEPIQVRFKLFPKLSPRLDQVELSAPWRTTGKVHPNDALLLHGDGLLLGGGEGRTVALVSGCFLPEGEREPCAQHGRKVSDVVLPVLPQGRFDREHGVLAYSPAIHGVSPGKFLGSIRLRNEPPGQAARPESAARSVSVQQVRPELSSLFPSAVSVGQYVELQGAGFVGGQAGQATLLRLEGQFSLLGSPVVIPVGLDLVVEYVPRFPSGPVGRYVLDETDALGQALEPRGGLRQAAGVFSGTGTLTLHNGSEVVSSKSVPLKLSLLRPKQVVVVRFLDSYRDSLRLFGLRTVDRAVRARVLEVARRDYLGVHVEFREADEETALPEDFALYAQVDIGGPDPNGLGYLGYDNTPGRDRSNKRLYDRIGGVNAVTQNDGSPGYGGVFAEQLLGFSAHPGSVESIQAAPADSEVFDLIFDPLRPDQGGSPATLREATLLPALSSGSLCPVDQGDRPRQVSCAIFVLGSLIGTTMTHELGHSLGLANPGSESASYHNNGTLRGRIMNPGSLRSFRERAELLADGPAVFCDTDYAYLQNILPGSAPPKSIDRPPCFDAPTDP